ncbi:MAG: hypothetical protein QXL89_09095 [Nitrososphaeria archaeon]
MYGFVNAQNDKKCVRDYCANDLTCVVLNGKPNTFLWRVVYEDERLESYFTETEGVF